MTSEEKNQARAAKYVTHASRSSPLGENEPFAHSAGVFEMLSEEIFHLKTAL